MLKKIANLLMVVVMICTMAACSSTEESSEQNVEQNEEQSVQNEEQNADEQADVGRTYVDMDGTTVTLPQEINTVVDVWAANNQVLVLLGVEDRLVGTIADVQTVPWMQKLNPGITDVPVLIENDKINVEEMLKVNPDVIIVNDRDVEGARSTGIPTVNLHFDDFDGLKEMIEKTAEIFGEEQMAIARDFNEYFQGNRDRLEAVADTIPEEERKVVLYIRSGNASAIQTDGKNTMASEWIETVGGINAASAAGIESFGKEMSVEEILVQNPDIVIIQDSDNALALRDEIKNSAAWADVTAVKENKLFINPNGVFYWDRYSAEEAMQILWAAVAVYPEYFTDIDIVEETQNFYKTFFYYDLTEDEANEILKTEENVDAFKN